MTPDAIPSCQPTAFCDGELKSITINPPIPVDSPLINDNTNAVVFLESNSDNKLIGSNSKLPKFPIGPL